MCISTPAGHTDQPLPGTSEHFAECPGSALLALPPTAVVAAASAAGSGPAFAKLLKKEQTEGDEPIDSQTVGGARVDSYLVVHFLDSNRVGGSSTATRAMDPQELAGRGG